MEKSLNNSSQWYSDSAYYYCFYFYGDRLKGADVA